MRVYKKLATLFHRFRNPVSLPEDIGLDLGIQVLHNELNFQECMSRLTGSICQSKYLHKLMPRAHAEAVFKKAVHKESFKDITLFSYYVYSGWLAFKLVFDEEERLRRVYLQHKAIKDENEGVEMILKDTSFCKLK